MKTFKSLSLAFFILVISVSQSFSQENEKQTGRSREFAVYSCSMTTSNDCFRNLSGCLEKSPLDTFLDILSENPRNLMRFSQISKFTNEYITHKFVKNRLEKKRVLLNQKNKILRESYSAQYKNIAEAKKLLEYVSTSKILIEEDIEQLNLIALKWSLPQLEEILHEIKNSKHLTQFSTMDQPIDLTLLKQLEELSGIPSVVESIEKYLEEMEGSASKMVTVCLKAFKPKIIKYSQPVIKYRLTVENVNLPSKIIDLFKKVLFGRR